MRNIYLLALLSLFIVGSPKTLNAQSRDTVPITLEDPENTMMVHLHYLQAETYQPELAARSLWISEIIDSAQAEKLAIQLKQVLDGAGLYVRFNAIPADPDYRDTTTNEFVFTPFPAQIPEIYLERRESLWYYSRETVEMIPNLHKRIYPFGSDLLLNLTPKFGQERFLGLYTWQYIGILVLLILAALGQFVLSRLLNPLVSKLSQSRLYPSLVPKQRTWRLARLVSFLVIVRLLRLFVPPLQLPAEVSTLVIKILGILSIVLVILIGLAIVRIVMIYADRFTKRTESKLDEQLVPILKRTLQAIVVVFGLIQVLRLFNINPTPLLAGLSIGGLALALAAQDTLKNLFGSLTIFLDKPFQIGDWINFKGLDGTVEEVGFRSTRVRTFANSLIYVPNGQLADSVIDNFGLRVYRRFKMTISITYDTPPDLIEVFVDGIRGIVATHPKMRKDYYEIHLNEMGAHSLDILFYTFMLVPDYSTELKTRHEILLAILRLAEKLGVRFAFPTQTIHIEELPGQGATTPEYPETAEAYKKRMQDFLKTLE